MSDTKTAVGSLYIQIFADCPNCDFNIDILNPDDTSGHCHNDEGHVLAQACPSQGHWSDEHEKFKVEEVTCSECNHTFNVEKLEW